MLLRVIWALVFISISLSPVWAFYGSDKGTPSVKELLAKLKDRDPRMRIAALRAISKKVESAGETTPALIQVLKKDNSYIVRSNAAIALGNIKATTAIPVMLDILKNENNGDVRYGIIVGLGQFGKAANSAVPLLLLALKDREYQIRQQAAESLGSIKWTGQFCQSSDTKCLENLPPDNDLDAVVKALIVALNDSLGTVRERAAIGLGFINVRAPMAVPALITALSDQKANVQWAAVQALGHFRDLAVPAVPEIIKLLKDEDSDVRLQAVQTLGIIGPKAVAAIPALRETLKDQNSNVRTQAEQSIRLISGL